MASGPAPQPTPVPTPTAPADEPEDDGEPTDDFLASLIDTPSIPASADGPKPKVNRGFWAESRFDEMGDDLSEAAKRLEMAGVHGQIIPCKGGDDYAQAKRPTIGWKDAQRMAAEKPDELDIFAPVNTGAAALVLSPKTIVVDLDMPKGKDAADDLPDGQHLLYKLAPEAFNAARAVVQTGSYGWHLFFDAPEGVELINRAHPMAGERLWEGGPAYEAGVPIDVRTNHGYVVMAGSRAGRRHWGLSYYDSEHADQPHPMPKSLLDLLDRLGFVKHEDKAAKILADVAPRGRDPFTGLLSASNGKPDLSPVSEGSRNDTIHAQCYGRHVNHPDECARIDSETIQRATASGLPESEARTIVHSVHQALGLGA